MGRVLEPLGLMGAPWLSREGGRLPLTLRGGGLKGVDYILPMASAQVKSAVLLAGLKADGPVTVTEPEPTRDHTERMLKAFGASLSVSDHNDRRVITLQPGARLTGSAGAGPGGPPSAAFPIRAG